MSTNKYKHDPVHYELERNGPKQDVEFTREQVNDLIKKHLNKTVIKYDPLERGANNSIYLIVTEDQHNYVLKVTGRFWTKYKTENEVHALKLISKYTTIPVSNVIAFDSNKSNDYGEEWILMTKLAGQPLDKRWPKMSKEEKKKLLLKLSLYIQELKQNLPKFDKIGGLSSFDTIGSDPHGNGPWLGFQEFYNDRLQVEIEALKQDNVFDPIRTDVLNMLMNLKN
ncbi:unnamed protein product [Didymodactylos carnosus]|uniref:Aminoglycoside phosphotransferase domain-containing protein n=1 Tax=Didymodactylos carnosus TaxID=1234261 RepID=A0A815Q162_9BILA|nr:unnamed protein product [Didymodactylos carnosus]CAF1557606.1 unnamed protein product [Didymodactylos carnosus]CAF4328016.1 unnamed protein product [Didymodactylos carnosus]CAF4348831.1 unnamed protein product [Didymodactylos carnosus]